MVRRKAILEQTFYSNFIKFESYGDHVIGLHCVIYMEDLFGRKY